MTRDNYGAHNTCTVDYQYRTQLFKDIYVASLANQHLRPSEVWLMGPHFPHADHLENYGVPCRLVDGGIAGCRERLRFGNELDCDLVVTTRVDNDDAIHPTFIESVQQALDGLNIGTYICFTKGIYWDKVNRRCAIVNRKNNQFLSRFEWRAKAKTVYEHKHGHAKPIVHIETDEPMWVWTIHADDERQMSNHSGSVRTALKNIPDSCWQDESILERFGIQV